MQGKSIYLLQRRPRRDQAEQNVKTAKNKSVLFENRVVIKWVYELHTQGG